MSRSFPLSPPTRRMHLAWNFHCSIRGNYKGTCGEPEYWAGRMVTCARTTDRTWGAIGPGQRRGESNMRKHVLFIQGGGPGAYEVDGMLAASLRHALGPAYDVRYPKMPHEEDPEMEAWKAQIAAELAT